MPGQLIPITLMQEEDYSLSLQVTSDGVTPINIAGATLKAWMRPAPGNPVTEATFTLTITNAALGQATMTLAGSVIAGLQPTSDHWYDLWIIYAGGQQQNFQFGPVTVLPATTTVP